MFVDLALGPVTDPIRGEHWDRAAVLQRYRNRVELFARLGVQRGHRVLLHYGNTPQFLVDLLAIWGCGGCAIPIDTRLTPFEVETLNIVDWEATGDHVCTGLLRAALEWGRFARVQVWTVNADPSRRRLLRAEGFADAEPSGVRTCRGALLVYRLDTARSDETWNFGRRNLLDVSDWDLRMLYSMAG
jgi:acyl-CoA synthetase (AMP-forming)/AMP-acid ligase II